MTMLIFAAPLTRRFRFVSIVTILQQTAAVFVENATTWTAAEATDAKRPREAMGNRLQKSWANAGAFSLLTPRSKLAQY
jgi:hypothetical protein